LLECALVEQFRQHRRITDVAGGNFDRPNHQRFFVDLYVDFALNQA
jgi:hypothetical protein